MQPIIKPLAKPQRTVVFVVLLLAFLFSLPAFIFYATGYRYDFANDKIVTATGGLYIQANAPTSIVYIDGQPVKNARLFRNASYIQGIEPGVKTVHVEAVGLDTWVKELYISPQMVTEAEAFNLPLRPQVRHVSEYQTNNQDPVVFSMATSSAVFLVGSSTRELFIATTTATSTYRVNREYVLLSELFSTLASTTKLRQGQKQDEQGSVFGFSTTTNQSQASSSLIIATTTVESNSLRLYESGEDVYALTLATGNRIPHYFCQKEQPLLTTALDELQTVTTSTFSSNILTDCRTVIRLDRKGQTVLGFDFYPPNNNLVLLHLHDGIYVVEIDDRSWQNSQLLYPGTDLMMLVYQGRIFVKENNNIFEVLTEIVTR